MTQIIWNQKLRQKRTDYGISQVKLAVAVGISREHLNKLESGKSTTSEVMQTRIMEVLERFNPDAPLEMLFDYVRIRFPTTDIKHVAEDIMRVKLDYMAHEDYGFYSYSEHYYLGDIFILTSPDEKKGVLLELKGRGCRQFEGYLIAQGRSWYSFLADCLYEEAVIKRIDLAINDKFGILNIPALAEKCEREECISIFRSFRFYRSGDLIQSHEEDKMSMGHTLYIGSLKSEIYFCLYQKDYEQFKKLGIPIEEAPVKNRFEIRLKNERAYHAVCDLLAHEAPEQTAFQIINRYLCFVDRDERKPRSEWKMSADWAWFIGDHRDCMKLTTAPEPYTLERTIHWLQHQVAPTLKMMQRLDELEGIWTLPDMIERAKLTDRQRKIIQQQSVSISEVIT